MRLLIEELLSQFRVADLIDIAIVSVLIYLALTWFRSRASRSLGIVLFSLSIIFLLARWLEMYLTTMIFQVGFVGLILVVIVIFQQDIRHGFERLATSARFRSSKLAQPKEGIVATLTEAIDEMAKNRVGALLVFPGYQPVDRHLRGGVRVDAEVSEPLLLSIFHPKSPGHDGAILIEGQRISKLGLHLPLSANLTQIHDGGTRHAAALGLSECSDAIAVSVSEERGTISLARNGELKVVEADDIANMLREHYSRDGSVGTSTKSDRLQSLAMKFTSLVIAIALWFLFAYAPESIQRTIVVPIEYRNLPKGHVVEEPKATYAEVTLDGSQRAFDLLEVATVTVSLNVDAVSEGVPIRLDTENAVKNIPSELRISEIFPSEVIVTVRDKTGG